MLSLPSVTEIGTSRQDLIAFRVTGTLTSADMDTWAARLNTVFDAHSQLDLLVILDRYGEAEGADTFDWQAIKSWFRAGSSLGRYLVVGEATHAQVLIDGLSSILPVAPEIFDEEIAAWRVLDAHAEAI